MQISGTLGGRPSSSSAYAYAGTEVGARAYLIRNLIVHSARVRRAVLDVTLPPFAGLVRECIGYVANNGEADATLKTAKVVTIDVRHAANRISDKELSAVDAIESLLPDELGTAATDKPQFAAEAEEEAPADEVGVGEPVPVEDVERDDMAATREDPAAGEVPLDEADMIESDYDGEEADSET